MAGQAQRKATRYPPALDGRHDREKVVELPPSRTQAGLLAVLAPQDVGLFHTLLAGHGHLAHFTVLEPGTALVRICFAPDRGREVAAVLAAIAKDIPLDLRGAWPDARRPRKGDGREGPR